MDSMAKDTLTIVRWFLSTPWLREGCESLIEPVRTDRWSNS
jgi:hypothetical protein